MKRLITFLLVLAMVSTPLVPVMAAEGDGPDIYQEAESYTKTNAPLTVVTGSTLSGSGRISLYTTNIPDSGEYYVEYDVEVPEAGAYTFMVSTFNMGHAVSCSEVEVSVNGGQRFNLYTDASVGNTLGAGLYPVTVKYLPGFVKGHNILRLSIPRTRGNDNTYVATFDYFTLTRAGWSVRNLELQGDVYSNVYEKGTPVSVKVNYSEPSEGNKALSLVITDYYDQVVHTEDYSKGTSDMVSNLSLPDLDTGWYRAAVQEGSILLGYCNFVVVKPYAERNLPDPENNPFGIDAVQSITGYWDKIPDNFMAMKLMGVGWARDRLYTSPLFDSNGNYQYSDNMGYMPAVYKMGMDAGIKIHAMIDGMPRYTMTNEISGSRISSNILAMYELGKHLGEDYGDIVADFEILNEPEGDSMSLSAKETGDKYSALAKAMSLGIRDSGTDAFITSCGFAPTNTEVLDICVRNGLLDYMDVLAYHSHTSANYDSSIQHLRQHPCEEVLNILHQYGYDGIPQWLDEAGIAISGEDTKGQTRQAEYFIMAHAESFAQNVDRYFAYIFWFDSSMGLYSNEHTGPLRIVYTYSVMTDMLGEAKYLGTVNNLPEDGDNNGYVFRDRDREVMLLYANGDAQVTIPDSVEVYSLLGKPLTTETTANGGTVISFNHEPVYVIKNGSFSEGVYTPANYPEKVTEEKTYTPAERVILSQIYPEDLQIENSKFNGYQITAENTEVTLTVTNLNDTSMKGEINAQTGGGWEILPANTTVNIPAFSTVNLSYRLKKNANVLPNVKTAVTFKGIFDGEDTSPSVVDVVLPGEIEYLWNGEFKNVTDASRWETAEHVTEGGSIKVTEDADSAVFKFDFDPYTKDFWGYPRFHFAEDESYNMNGSTGIVVRYEAPVDCLAADINSRIYMYERNGATYLTKQPYNMVQGVGEIIVPWTGFKMTGGSDADFQLTPSDVVGFSIGLNSGNSVRPGPTDVPAYKILSVGFYTMVTKDTGYAKITGSTPANQSFVTQAPEELTAVFDPGNAAPIADSFHVYVDGVEAEAVYEDNVLTVPGLSGLGQGDHVIDIRYLVQGSGGQKSTIEFTVDSREISYQDIDGVPWAAEAIEFLSRKNVVNGKEAGYFAPDDPITRAEFIKLISAAFGLSKTSQASGYADVSEDAWYTPYVTAAERSAVLNGIYGDSLGPDVEISRQDMAAILYNTALTAKISIPEVNRKKIFLDKGDFADYAAKAISAMQLGGILDGRDALHFMPLDTLTRVEAAKAVHEVLKLK